MNVKADAVIQEMLANGNKNFSKLKMPGACFKGLNLKEANFRGASVPDADFRDSDLTYATFEGGNAAGADFTHAKCHRTNFKDCDISNSIMRPSDLYGVTITLECKSFQGIKTDPGWWWGWVFYALLMEAPSKDAEERLITAMGIERYQVLRSQYVRRQM